MTYIRYLLLGLLAVLLIAIALANRGPVTLQLLPDDMAPLLAFQQMLTVPVFLVFFGGILAGLLIGFVWEWLREHKHRAAAAQRKAELRRLERQLKRTEAERDKDKDEVLAILDQSR